MNKNSWIIKVFIWTFILAVLFSYSTNVITNTTNITINSIILLTVIFLGIIFDMIGTGVLTAKEATFHAMNSQKVKGAKEAIKLIKNRVQVSSICNDIIGDICGIVSGGLTAVLAINISNITNVNILGITIILSAITSSLTVGGKAIGKNIAYKNCDKIITKIGKFLTLFTINTK